MTELRQRVARLENAATSSTHYTASADDLANYPSMLNLVAGNNITLTPGAGTLTIDGDAWIGTNSGTGYAAASTSLAADTTWYDTGASVSLAAGTYLVSAFANGFLRTTAGTGKITSRLYNVTAAAAIASSECLILGDDNATRRYGEGALSLLVTVAGTSTIRLEASRLAGATYAVSPTITSDTSGRSGITYTRIY